MPTDVLRLPAAFGNLATFAFRAAPALWKRISEDAQREIEPVAKVPQVQSWSSTGLHATWIGHSTVLLSMDGFTILTDPVFSSRIGIELGPVTIGMKRLVAPAAQVADLPTPDLILLSHAHMDHFDLPSLRKLESPKSTVVTAVNTSDLLRIRRYGEVRELAWNQSTRVGPATIRAFEVKHWGARMQHDVHRSYNGYLIEVGNYRVIFAGDTAYTDKFRQLCSSKPVDLAIMPVGAYNPWIHAHCNPEQAVAMANDAGAEFILPVHHRTFELSNEPKLEPLARTLAAVGSAEHRICIRDFGEELHLS
jgi:L-ascorbate metabolism protein UlaG (beta-lactamase superfamily)